MKLLRGSVGNQPYSLGYTYYFAGVGSKSHFLNRYGTKILRPVGGSCSLRSVRIIRFVGEAPGEDRKRGVSSVSVIALGLYWVGLRSKSDKAPFIG